MEKPKVEAKLEPKDDPQEEPEDREEDDEYDALQEQPSPAVRQAAAEAKAAEENLAAPPATPAAPAVSEPAAKASTPAAPSVPEPAAESTPTPAASTEDQWHRLKVVFTEMFAGQREIPNLKKEMLYDATGVAINFQI